MKFLLLLGVLNISIFATEDYLSNFEYGKRLFHNPRGIACSECHGERGDGGILSAYVININGKKELKEIKIPKINDINMTQFLKPFKDMASRRYMPTYYLTKEELAYIYYYLQKVGKEPAKPTEEENKEDIKQEEQNINKEANNKTEIENKEIKKEITKDVNATDKNNSK